MSKQNFIQSPLHINIYWHHASEKMYQLADTLYEFYAGNIKNPLDSYLNIPVRLYPYVPTIDDLQLETAQHTANVFLIENKMILSKEWRAFGEKLGNKTADLGEKQHRLLPVAISHNAFKWNPKIAQKNFIRLYDESKKSKTRFLLTKLSHDITRLLYEEKAVSNTSQTRYMHLPIKLFLSHAKSDGLEITKKLLNYIRQNSGLDTFFDALDIPSGVDFSEEIAAQVKESLLVVIHSDRYSSRQWCRKEVLCAKENNCPIIVVNLFKKGEYRSFPYIGNIPHIHYTEGGNEEKLLQHIVLEAIREALRFRYNILNSTGLAKAFEKPVPPTLAYPPELITLIKLKEVKDTVILYPDPPIGEEELSLLETFRPDLKFITPTLLPLLAEDGQQVKDLKQLKVAISLSEIQDAELAWIHNRAIQNLMVEITRYLLVSGAQLIYSGDFNYEEKAAGFNFVKLLIEIIKTHQQSYTTEQVKAIDNYSFYPVSTKVDEDLETDLMDWVNFIRVAPPEHLNATAEKATYIIQFDTFDKKCVWAATLTQMRKEMLKAANAFIVLGGKSLSFKGRMPGVLEETLLALQVQKPVFLIGAFGGVASAIIRAIQGGKPRQLTETYYQNNYHPYAYFLKKYNKEWAKGDEIVDYDKILQFFNHLKTKPAYGLNNGLSKAENDRLFYTKNETEILTLIFKGLKNIANNGRFI